MWAVPVFWIKTKSRIPLKPVLGGVGIIALSISSHEHTPLTPLTQQDIPAWTLKRGLLRICDKYQDKLIARKFCSHVSLLSFRFTLSIWLYILEYCPEAVVPGQLCSIMYHLNQNTAYRTPLLFLTPEGNGT